MKKSCYFSSVISSNGCTAYSFSLLCYMLRLEFNKMLNTLSCWKINIKLLSSPVVVNWVMVFDVKYVVCLNGSSEVAYIERYSFMHITLLHSFTLLFWQKAENLKLILSMEDIPFQFFCYKWQFRKYHFVNSLHLMIGLLSLLLL